MTPKPLVDILDVELDELVYQLTGRRVLTVVNVPDDLPAKVEATNTRKAIIKAIKERVPKRKPVLDDNDEEFKGLYQNEIREYKAVTLGHNSAIDQLNQNLWGHDD